ncbi:HlyD family secretion protein [Nonomuraea typhae]|uniref:HlyD family secretion protein n=1 Tax=Nonomuraea typhae TaxID=2603600 RepID=UPI0015E1BBC3|nr:biotin/lipoyl-binding protein [Nonomuraea typhae]
MVAAAGNTTFVMTLDAAASTVSAVGALSANREGSLGFLKGGKLIRVNVKVGEEVSAGQVLAVLDSYDLRRTLGEQRADLAGARADWAQTKFGTTVPGARRTLAQARRILAATESQGGALLTADNVAIRNTLREYTVDEEELWKARDRLAHVISDCELAREQALKQAEQQSTDPEKPDQDDQDDQDDQNGQDSQGSQANQACAQIPTYQTQVSQARQKVSVDRSAVNNALAKHYADRAANQTANENVRQSVVSAFNTLDAATADRPWLLRQLKATIRATRQAVRSARHDVRDATLRAPFSGTVSAVNGTVGEILAPSNDTTVLAPGTDAPIPGVELTTTPFIVLSDTETLRLVLSYQESDAVKIAPGQTADVTFPAFPGLVVPGTVLAVGPNANASADVSNYYVTVVLQRTDPRLRPGITAEAAIKTG